MATKTAAKEWADGTFKTFQETELYKRWVIEGVISPVEDEPDDLSDEERKDARVARLDAALNALGDELRRNGVTLEDLIESGREIRGELFREKYERLKSR